MSWTQNLKQRFAGGATANAPDAVDAPLVPDPNTLDEFDEWDVDLEVAASQSQKVAVASQWKLIWWRFRKNKLAIVSALVLAWLYFVALFADVLAPYDPNNNDSRLTYAAPQPIRFFDEGRLSRPFVYGITSEIDREALRRVYRVDPDAKVYLGLFVPSEPYKLWGLIPLETRLWGPIDPDLDQRAYLLGADRLGNDLLSRMIFATRISLSIGLVGIFLSLLIGVTLGGISGYFGGGWDLFIQRVMEFLDAIPSIPLWMGLSAAIPLTWSQTSRYFAISVILSLIGWIGLARVVRGRFLSLREEDFVMAARIAGANERRVIFRHMLPSFTSHIVASLTLSIPGAILAETSLSFLGLGLKSPINSFGVLLQEAQNIRAIATAPWLVAPAGVVIVLVIAFNYFGDGLRDAADPYA
jgi:peptide/nickel transport system permease protein